ncbi:MAG: glycosyltransferase [Patescibacteria group bacterium]
MANSKRNGGMKNIVANRRKIKKADLVVGIPSLNEADNISFVVKQADIGLTKYFKDKKAVIINVDNNSSDGTKKEFLGTKTKTPKIYISTPGEIKGKGNNFFNLFNQIIMLKAKAVVVVDADLLSITPEWIKWFCESILEGNDYTTPIYARCEYDGTITNNICYPLIYGLFGQNIRQPIGGDFSFSPELAQRCLKQKWHKTTKQYGIDIFMTMNAVLGGLKIAQVGLGAKIHKPSAPKLGPMFSQVVTTLFKNIQTSKDKWTKITSIENLPRYGKKELEKPQTLGLDYKGIKATSIFNFHANEDILKQALSPSVFQKLKKMYVQEKIEINKELWYKIVYDIYYAYDSTEMGGGLVEALKPLYWGRVASFFKSTLDKPFVECEKEINDQAKLFWKNRNYLIKKYKK